MKLSTAVLATVLCLLCSQGCHAQAPPPTKGYQVSLSATVPAADGNSNPYNYAVFREEIAGPSCDPTTSANWKEITASATRPSAPAYNDTSVAASGGVYCYFMVTYQQSQGSPSVAQNSGPSNVVQVTVPGVPTAPALNPPSTSQQADLWLPEIQNLEAQHPTLEANCVVHDLTARIAHRI